MSVLFFQSGCASYIAYNRFQEAQAERAIFIDADGQEVRVGVDFMALDYLKSNWPMALGAAVVDGVIFYGAYKLYDNNFGSSSSGSSSNRDSFNVNANSGRDTTIIITPGDGSSGTSDQGDTTTTSTF